MYKFRIQVPHFSISSTRAEEQHSIIYIHTYIHTYIHMDSGTRVYKEFEPTWDFVAEEDCDTLLLYLTGFTKEQLRVQLTRTRKLIVSGERAVEGNTWTRFRKQFAVSNNCDVNGISARFDAGILHIRQPKQPMPAKIVDQELQKPKNSTEDPPQLPQNAPNPVSEPSKTDDTDKKHSEDIKELPDLKDARQPKDEEMEDDSKSFGLKKRNNYELRYKSVIDRVGVEVKTWSKMMMIIVLIIIVLLGIYINHDNKAMKQPLSLR